MRTEDEEVMCALIHQVTKAAAGGNERDVRTIITRGMWDAFCRAADIPEGSEPTEWKGIHSTYRVYGSETVVIESSEMKSFSYKP